MKIYHVEFENKKYSGANNITFSVGARSMEEARAKGNAELVKDCKAEKSAAKNWEMIRVEKTDEI